MKTGILMRAALAAAILTGGAGAATTTGEGAGPRAVVEQVSSQVLDVLGRKDLNSEQKRKKVEEIVYAYTDFDVLTRLVLAQNYKKFSDAQLAAFTNEFKRHLSVTYGRNVESYHNEKVQTIGDHEEARGDWTVNTKILRGGGNEDVLVDYRLRKSGDQWKVIDMIIERVSLVSNFRSQFQDMLASGTPDQLIRLLHEKNEKGEPLKANGKA